MFGVATLFATMIAVATALTTSTDAAARVRRMLESTDCTMLPPEALAPTVAYRGDIARLDGAAVYAEDASRWHDDLRSELDAYSTRLLRCELLDDETVAFRWRAEWSGEQLRWLVGAAAALGWQVERFDVDARTVSSFSWRATATMFATAARTGTLRLPWAAVEGRGVVRLDAASGAVVEHVESIDLCALADRGQLLNRRAAADAATFMDFRRPRAVDPDEWAADVAARVLSGVPGAGVLDIEPSADDREGVAALGAFGLVAAAALAGSLAFFAGDSGSNGVFGTSLCDEVAQSDAWYLQCVSDVF